MITGQQLVDALNAIDAGQVRSYSGRGMNGRECVAIEPGNMTVFGLGVVLALHLGDEELADLDVKTDSMGRGTVIYFPGVAFPEDDPRADDDELSDEEPGQ